MEQTVATLNKGSNPLMNSLIKPLVIKDVILLAPGIWVGEDERPTEYTGEGIRNGFENTNWENMNLFLDHKDSKSSAVAYWIGFVRNSKMVGDELQGDLEIWHPLISSFIEQAKAKFGVSATMNGHEELNTHGETSSFKITSFRSMSLVDEPGCSPSWLPKMLSLGEKGDKKITAGIVEEENIKSLAKVTAMEEKRNKRLASVSEFYAVPRDPSSLSSLPIFDEENVRNALSRFGQTHFDNLSQKKTAWNKILSAAKKFGINISEEHSEKKLYNCKEVKEMTEQKQTQKNLEASKEEEKETDSKESDSGSEEKSNEEVKNLHAKIDKLTEVITSLSENVKTLAAEKTEESTKEEDKGSEENSEEKSEEKSEESTEEKSTEDSEGDSGKELEDTKGELDNTKKELAALKKEVNSPDRKTLASPGVNSDNVGADSANAGMLGFLREKANISNY